jgi:hypothetical protein
MAPEKTSYCVEMACGEHLQTRRGSLAWLELEEAWRVPIGDGLSKEARVGLARCGVCDSGMGWDGWIGYHRGSIGYLMSSI